MKPEETLFIDVLSALDSEIQSPDSTLIQPEEIAPAPTEMYQESEFVIIDDSHLFFEDERISQETPVLIEEVEEVREEILPHIVQEEIVEALVCDEIKGEIPATPLTQETPELPKKQKKSPVFSNFIFLAKYLCTSALIFAVLLFTTNYSAYSNIAMSFIFQKDFQEKSQSLLNSVQASSQLFEEKTDESHISLESATLPKEETFNSIETLASQAKRAQVDL